MRKLIFFSLMAVLLVAGCKTHTTQPTQTGELPVRMDLSPAAQFNITVTRVEVTIVKGSFSQSMDLAINGSLAEGTFEDLEPGVYAIDVRVYEGLTLIATGHGTGVVSPSQTTTVHITLQFVPGGLEIVVGWGLPYEASRRVLLVGNSHTYVNEGVDTHLQALMAAAQPEWNVVVEDRTAGGYTLENHYHDQNTLDAIATGDWDLVVLQEQSSRPMLYPELFYSYADSLHTLIQQSGARSGFYMTWAWRNNPEMYVPIRDAYRYIAAYLDALVVPAGVAWYNADALHGMPNLYDTDNYHPSIYGTYLVACLMMARIWNLNPMGNSYYPAQIDAASALMIQQLAWDTHQHEYRDLEGGLLLEWDAMTEASSYNILPSAHPHATDRGTPVYNTTDLWFTAPPNDERVFYRVTSVN